MIYWCTAQPSCPFAKTYFWDFALFSGSVRTRALPARYALIVSVIKVATWGSRVLIWWEQPHTGPPLYRCFIALQCLGPVGAGLVFSLTFITLSVPFYPFHNLRWTKTACQRFCLFFFFSTLRLVPSLLSLFAYCTHRFFTSYRVCNAYKLI